MKAIWNGAVVAEAPNDHLISIEGNWYFPSDSLDRNYFNDSSTKTVCPWKGEASYLNVVVNGETNPDAAWYYPQPKEGSAERAGQDFANYVAFWRGVEVK